MTRLFLVAGEASGDLHGSLLARALRDADPSIELSGVGGAEMERSGVRLVHRCETMGVTGLWEVVRHLPRLRRLIGDLARRMRDERPDGFIPIDYPDFNIRLAERVHADGIPIVYYISPQVWAWRRGRIRRLARLVRRMVVIFPFEEPLYREAGVPVSYVGHPLVDRVHPRRSRDEVRRTLGVGEGEHLIVLLPGSRTSEIERILPVFLRTRHRLAHRNDLRWVVALAAGLRRDDLPPGIDPALELRSGETHDLLNAADLALTASGTATLEAALLGVPMLVVYRMHPVTWHLARRLVRVPHIAMANLLAGRRVVPEFVQGEARPDLLAGEVDRWIADAELRRRTGEELKRAAATLGSGGAAAGAAAAILGELGRR